MVIEQQCRKCERVLPIEKFALHKSTITGRKYICLECEGVLRDSRLATKRAYYATNSEKWKAYADTRKQKDPDYHREYERQTYVRDKAERARTHKAWRQRLRARVIAAYGSICFCCGESNSRLLTLDHVNRDGNTHLRDGNKDRRSASIMLYIWAKKNDFPKDVLRLACYTCNAAREHEHGICPHELERQNLFLPAYQKIGTLALIT